jgi:hypothetical protein
VLARHVTIKVLWAKSGKVSATTMNANKRRTRLVTSDLDSSVQSDQTDLQSGRSSYHCEQTTKQGSVSASTRRMAMWCRWPETAEKNEAVDVTYHLWKYKGPNRQERL